jgi:signal transduction histidine kinase
MTGLKERCSVPKIQMDHRADRAIRRICVGNLLSNAVNYTERGSITISVAIGDAETEVPIRDRLGFARLWYRSADFHMVADRQFATLGQSVESGRFRG